MKTVVEWLYENLLDNPISNEDVIYNINIFEKAKEMNNDKLKEAYSMGRLGKSIKEFNETFYTMKTPKEKAMYLFDEYVGFKLQPYDDPEMSLKKELARAHALIAVDEVLEALNENQWQNRNYIDYYEEVKLEIERI